MTSTADIPAGIQGVLTILGVISFLITLIGVILTIRWSPRKANEAPRRGRPVHPVRFWRPSQYALALGYLEDFCQRLQQGSFYSGQERGRVTESDLVRWIIQLSLTCAAQMVPQSLGRATLFRVSQLARDDVGRTTGIRIYSSEFVGVFAPLQMASPFDSTYIRNLHLNEDQHSEECPAALQCVLDGFPTIQSLRQRKAAFDEPERSIGATHILGIPLLNGRRSTRQQDQVVSITVDLRFGRLYGWLLDHRDPQKLTIYRRAAQLASLLAEVEQLTDPRFAA
jgi:hypothetical protein